MWSILLAGDHHQIQHGPNMVAIWSQPGFGLVATGLGQWSPLNSEAVSGGDSDNGVGAAKLLIWRARQDSNLRPLPSEGEPVSFQEAA